MLLDQALKIHFHELEAQRKELLGKLDGISEERLNRSSNGKWSISQIAGHLIAAEHLSLQYMTKKINVINKVGNSGILGELKLLFYIVSQRLPLKYNAPKVLGNQPRSYLNYIALTSDWDQSRAALQIFLEGFPKGSLKKKIYRHPVMGRCNIVHALISFREHINHHRPQIVRQL